MKKNLAFEKWWPRFAKRHTMLDYEEVGRLAFEAGQRASDPMRREKEAVVKSAISYFATPNGTFIAVAKAISALQSAQRSRRHAHKEPSNGEA